MTAVQEIVTVKVTVRQAKLLRTILRLGAFTRKELVQAGGDDLTYVNNVVSEYERRGVLTIVSQRRSGRPGPPEDVYTLSERGEDVILGELRPLYEALKIEPKTAVDSTTYVPAAMEFKVARELVDEMDEKGNVTYLKARRAVSLLATVSESEGIPVEKTLEGTLSERDRMFSSERQKIANAHVNVLKGKLCWLAFGTSDTDIARVFGAEPGMAGLSYLQSAARTFRDSSVRDLADSLDYWGTRHLQPLLLTSLAQRPSVVTSLYDQMDATVLPVINKYIAEIARPAQAEILDGLVRFYDQYCPITEKAVALLDVRDNWMTCAIVKGKSSAVARSISIEDKSGGQTSKFGGESRRDLLFEIFEKNLQDYQTTPGGEKIEVILIGGEPKRTQEFSELAQNRIATKVKPFDLCLATAVGGYGVVDGAAQLSLSHAAEIGLASKLFRS